jgi:integrase
MKPAKPYPSFPLTPHVRGGWGKKYKGHQLYLPDPDPEKALADFHRRARLVDAGRDPVAVIRTEGATVGEVATRFAQERLADKEAGKIKLGTYDDYAAAMKEMVDELGRDTLVAELVPDDFTRLYRRLSERLGTHALARNIQAVRTMWNHAEENGWVERRPRYGSAFKKPRTGKRKGKPLEPHQIKKLLAKASGQVKAMILLGINAGYGAKDCSDLRRELVNFKTGVLVFPRPKMEDRDAIDRAATLWPETIKALREVMADRPDDELVFRTEKMKRPWVRTVVSRKGKVSHIDAVAQEFYKVCDAAEIQRRGFYELRHAHRSLADELEKPNAAARIMGHRLPGLAEVYVDKIEHDRLKEITDHIRLRVLGSSRGQTRREAKSPPRHKP